MTGLLGVPLGPKGSGRDRYGRAMALFAEGRISPEQLEAYRVAAAHDGQHPQLFLADRNLDLPSPSTEPKTESPR